MPTNQNYSKTNLLSKKSRWARDSVRSNGALAIADPIVWKGISKQSSDSWVTAIQNNKINSLLREVVCFQSFTFKQNSHSHRILCQGILQNQAHRCLRQGLNDLNINL